ncbi:MAG: translin family protein [Thermoplasmata archaeon]
MNNLRNLMKETEKALASKDTCRESAFADARKLIRACGGIIQRIQHNEDVTKDLSSIRDDAKQLKNSLNEHPDIYHSGFVIDALQEYCEAHILASIIGNKNLPTPKELMVPHVAYVAGMGDAIGELRRFAVNSLKDENTEKAEKYLSIMEDLYDALNSVGHYNSISPIRRKLDIARALIEKTKSEVITAKTAGSLRRKMESLEKELRKKK